MYCCCIFLPEQKIPQFLILSVRTFVTHVATAAHHLQMCFKLFLSPSPKFMPELICLAKYERNRGCYLLTPEVKEVLTLPLLNVVSVVFHLLPSSVSPLAKEQSSSTFIISELFLT